MLNYDLLNNISTIIGDSFYIYNNELFTKNYIDFLSHFRKIYPDTEFAYSYKTNYLPEICKSVDKLNGFAEVVSEMEYELALKIGVIPSRIIVNGPYKPFKALEKFLINGSIVNIDSFSEYENVKIIASNNLNKIIRIGIRCNYEFSGVTVSRFGIDVNNKNFNKLIEDLSITKNIKLEIVHNHFPTRELSTFQERADKIIEIYYKYFHHFKPKYIDLGGGLGGKVSDQLRKQLNFNVANYVDYANVIANTFNKKFQKSSQKPILLIEPGTSLVADTLQFVCRITEIKNIRGNSIAITTGSKVNFHPMASKINVPMNVISDGKSTSFYESIDISGYTCMEGDYLNTNYKGKLKVNDFLVFDNVGSYSIVFKPPFILPNVPIISIDGEKIKILKEAEDFSYIFKTYKF